MISFVEAAKRLQNTYPTRQITQALDYDSKWFLFMAVENPNAIDYDSPWYAVNKHTGAVRTFNPIDQLEKFIDAMHNRRVVV